jgi:putative transposase
MKKRFTEEQIVVILREAELGQKTVDQICREHGVSQNTYYVWKRKYSAMGEPDVKRLRELEKENGRLKRLLAERDVELDVMKEIIEKKHPA